MMSEGGEACSLPITFDFLKGTRPFNFQSNEPRDITYNPCPEILGGGVFKDILNGPFKYAEQIGYLKILIACIWGNDGRVGVAAHWSLWL